MFDIKKVATEIFSTLRTFNYEVAMFDEEGNSCYEPDSAVRFFTRPKNITIVLSEDGENSKLCISLGQSVVVSSVQGLLDSLRTNMDKFGIGFSVKKYSRELVPKDLLTNKVLEGRSLSGSTKSSYLKLEGARMIIRHAAPVDENKHGARARNIKKVMVENSEGERFLMPSCNLGAGRAMTRHISKGGHWSDEAGQQIAEMAKQQSQLRTCASYCRQNARKLDESTEEIVEACVGKVRHYRDIFEGIYRNYSKNIGMLSEENVMLNEDDEDFNERVDALSEKLQLEEDGVIDRSTCETVARALSGKVLSEKKVEMQALPALGLEVERSAWDSFKNDDNPSLNLAGPVEMPKTGPTANRLVIALQQVAAKVRDDAMSLMLSKVAERLEAGETSGLLKAIALRAIKLAGIALLEDDDSAADSADPTDGDDNDNDDVLQEAAEMIDLPRLGCKVEAQAWEDLKSGKISLRHPVSFPTMGASANQIVIKLQAVAKEATFSGLANMLSRVADNIDLGRGSPLDKAIANTAILAATTEGQGRQDGKGYSVSMQESALIVTREVREYGRWFDSLSPSTMFESLNDAKTPTNLDGDDFANAMDDAMAKAVEGFNVEDFLVMRGDDFNYGDNDIDQQVDANELMKCIASYLKSEAGAYLSDDAANGDDEDFNDAPRFAKQVLSQVIDKLETEGYTVTGQEAIESDDTDLSDVDSDMVDFHPGDDLEETNDPVDDDGLDDKEELLLGDEHEEGQLIEYGDELAPEDVILPRNPARDFAKDVRGDDSQQDVDRLVTLAGIRRSEGPQVRPSPYAGF